MDSVMTRHRSQNTMKIAYENFNAVMNVISQMTVFWISAHIWPQYYMSKFTIEKMNIQIMYEEQHIIYEGSYTCEEYSNLIQYTCDVNPVFINLPSKSE
jgi:hypothetical protein